MNYKVELRDGTKTVLTKEELIEAFSKEMSRKQMLSSVVGFPLLT